MITIKMQIKINKKNIKNAIKNEKIKK